MEVGLAVAAEPFDVPDHPHWFGDASGSVAICTRRESGLPPCSGVERDRGLVMVKWGRFRVLGCYFSPNRTTAEFEGFLDRLAEMVGPYTAGPLLVLGDLNARSTTWGDTRTTPRGRELERWAEGQGLQFLNRGSVPTCVRSNGYSIVDVTLANPRASCRVSNWLVWEGETLSDHSYITMDVAVVGEDPPADTSLLRRDGTPSAPRWTLSKLDVDLLRAASIGTAWPATRERGPDEGAVWFRDTMRMICDVAMPRTRSLPPKKATYWWSARLAELRRTAGRDRRRYVRARRRLRNGDDPVLRRTGDGLYREYRSSAVALKTAIAEAKAKAWSELLLGLHADPWGRPYKLVLGKLRQWAPPITEGMDSELLERVVGTLFPPSDREEDEGVTAPVPGGEVGPVIEWSDELRVTEWELSEALRERQARGKKAPGPDGVPGGVMAVVVEVHAPTIRQILTECLRRGTFPRAWKEATLVLLRKKGKPADSPSAYRPVCLLDEVGKLFERIIAARLREHLARGGPDLSDGQFGFRRGRSTIDALERLRLLREGAVAQGGVLIAVSLDISNAFNTLPWKEIEAGLEYFEVPLYLRAVIRDYLRDRTVGFTGRCGRRYLREMSRGVPQGSVLGPFLWNIGYDSVLRVPLPPGAGVICYADDTLVYAEGKDWKEAGCLVESALDSVVGRIRSMGLVVAAEKTEAIWLYDTSRSRWLPRGFRIRVVDTPVEVGPTMKYLGLTLDGRWRFEEHFNALGPRLEGTANALAGLLPNLGGPRDGVRRLYSGVVRSIALYGAPVWYRAADSRRTSILLERIRRRLSQRIIRGYRTISTEVAGLLAVCPPLRLEATERAVTYTATCSFRQIPEEDRTIANGEELELLKRQARADVFERWRTELSSSDRPVVRALLPIFERWCGRPVGLSYRLTQMLTGHGCFGEYLHRIGREPAAVCHHCGEEVDSVRHTLEECPSWSGPRRDLRRAVEGWDLSLPILFDHLIASERSRSAVASFCETVMSAKEAAERVRERTPGSRRTRRRGRPPRTRDPGPQPGRRGTPDGGGDNPGRAYPVPGTWPQVRGAATGGRTQGVTFSQGQGPSTTDDGGSGTTASGGMDSLTRRRQGGRPSQASLPWSSPGSGGGTGVT